MAGPARARYGSPAPDRCRWRRVPGETPGQAHGGDARGDAGLATGQRLQHVHPLPQAVPTPVPSTLTGMTLAWVDEFNETALDPTRWEDTGLWYARGDFSPDGHNGDIARPSQVSVTGGNLVLSATRRAINVDGVTYPWIDGFVDTSPNDLNPGFRIRAPFYAEVCAKLPPVSPGEWPAIVMYQSPINGATKYAEMDLLERVGAPATAWMSFHPAGSAAGFAERIDPSIDLSAAFHTYGIYVDPAGNIQYYLDGAKVGAVIPGGTNAMEPMFMSIGMTVGACPMTGGPGYRCISPPVRSRCTSTTCGSGRGRRADSSPSDPPLAPPRSVAVSLPGRDGGPQGRAPDPARRPVRDELVEVQQGRGTFAKKVRRCIVFATGVGTRRRALLQTLVAHQRYHEG